MIKNKALISDTFWSVIAIVIILAGVLGFKALGALREPIKAVAVVRVVPGVNTQPLVTFNQALPIRGEGFIQPLQSLGIAAQSSGLVMDMHPSLYSLGSVRRGEVLVQLDDRTASATFERSRSDLASVQARLDLNATQLVRANALRKRGVISQEELDRRLSEKTELEAALSGFTSALDSARIALEKTQIIAPFNGRINARHIEPGEVIMPGQALAELYTDDALEVNVALSEAAAALIPDLFTMSNQGDNKALNSDIRGRIETQFAGHQLTWQAYVSRVSPVVDPATRMLSVTLRLEGKAALSDAASMPIPSGLPPALINSYAQGTIEGMIGRDVYAIPASALRQGDVIWLAVADRLVVHAVTTVLQDKRTAYIRAPDLPDDAQLITSLLDVPIAGMPVKTSDLPNDVIVSDVDAS